MHNPGFSLFPSHRHVEIAETKPMTIDVLLPTFNGERFVGAQVESILAQESPYDIRLIIRDDGSSDGTQRILSDIASRDCRICYLGSFPNRGVKDNLNQLALACGSEYVMLADQDDIWLPEKVRKSVSAIVALEQSHSKRTPAMVFTDARVVDEQLHVIHTSMWRYQRVEPSACNDLSGVLTQNCVTGCTLVMNRALLELAFPIPAQAVMHDWWIALVAAGTGHATGIRETAVLYRQHSHNVVGARRYSMAQVAKSLISWRTQLLAFRAAELQSSVLRQRIQDLLSRRDSLTLSLFGTSRGVLDGLRLFFVRGVRKTGLVRNVWLLICLLFLRNLRIRTVR